MSQGEMNRYDEVPYSDYPVRDSHPIGLEAVATLFGLKPAAVPTARVLELGCASGGNLIPQAQDIPTASFLGVDLSDRQVEAGRAAIRALNLKNIELRACSILDIDASWGQFDYILCHGVFSWVPVEVQNKILEVCRTNLSPQGVAFVSFNVLPGWHMRRAVREMVLYHVEQFKDAQTQIMQSRKLLEFLEENTNTSTAWGKMLATEVELLKKTSDAYIYHEHLEEINMPFYFHEFAGRAQNAGLQYLADTELASMVSTNLPPAAQQALANVPLIRKEQYMDFIRNRTFRKTLLCHANARVSRTVSVWELQKFHLALTKRAEFEAPAENEATGRQNFRIGKSVLSSQDPLVLGTVKYLNQIYPEFVSFETMFAAVVAALPPGLPPVTLEGPFSKQSLLTALTTALFSGMIDLAIHPPRFVRQVSERPKVTPLARWQAEHGVSVTNRRHEVVKVDDLTRYFLRRFDGKHHLTQVRRELTEQIQSGQMTVTDGEQTLRSFNDQAADGMIQQILSHLSKNALLVS